MVEKKTTEDFDWSGFNIADDWETGEFSSEEITEKRKVPESQKLINDRKQYVRFMDTMYNRVSSAEDLIGKLPKKNEQIRIITQKSFNAFALLLLIIQKYKISELYLAIYRIDKNSVEGLKNLILDGQIKQATIVISSFFRSSKKAETWHNNLVEFAQKTKNIKVVYCWNHAKILAVKTVCKQYFVIEGSGNLSDNARIEQYLFENRKETFEFHRDWINDLYATSTTHEYTEI